MRLLLALLLVATGLFVAGCASTDYENTSARPWNQPRGWEHGLPSTINEGR